MKNIVEINKASIKKILAKKKTKEITSDKLKDNKDKKE